MPFGAPFDGYYEQIIKPVANDLGRRAVRSDELYGTRAIVEDIWSQIWRATVVIADVTDKNPNVNYEPEEACNELDFGIIFTLVIPEGWILC
jgi:hypothetical protein